MGKLQLEIDVLMPFHNLSEFFEAAILSVLQSTHVKITLLLLDNRRDSRPEFSLKPFEHILKYTGHQIRIIPVKYPYTYAKALNTGIAKSTANYIALMNSDDLVVPERFYLQSNQLINQKGDIAICTLTKFSGVREIRSISGSIDLQYFNYKYLLLGAYGADASLMMKSEWVKSTDRFFPESRQSDWLFALKYYSDAKIVSINEPLYLYRMHNQQFTKNNFLNTLEREISIQLEKHFESIGILITNKNILIAISASFLRVKLGIFETREFLDVCDKYLLSFDSLEQQKNVKKILARRILVVLRYPHLFFIVHPKWWIALSREFFCIIIDLLTGKIKIFAIRRG